MRTPQDVIINMMRTEKGSNMLPLNKYVFVVDKRANKVEIREAVEKIYKVSVSRVNVMNVPGKRKRLRFREGYTSEWKKAIVTLKPESKIEVT